MSRRDRRRAARTKMAVYDAVARSNAELAAAQAIIRRADRDGHLSPTDEAQLHAHLAAARRLSLLATGGHLDAATATPDLIAAAAAVARHR